MPLTEAEEYTMQIAVLLIEIVENTSRLKTSEFVPHTSALHMADGTCFRLAAEIKLAAERLQEMYVNRQVAANDARSGR